MELNRKEIIKSLECCEQDNCRECPSRGNCHELHSYALALVKELIEENNRCVVFISEEGNFQINPQEELLGHPDPVGDRGICGCYKQCQADTVHKFAEYLKKHSFMCDPGNGHSFDAIDADELDEFVEEFLEENDDV